MTADLHYNRKNFGSRPQFWIGTVEDRADPLGLGRVRVRVHGYHTNDKNRIPTKSLPWAVVITDNHGGVSSVGTSPAGLMQGAKVLGIWGDWPDCQIPIVLGAIPQFEGQMGRDDAFDPETLTIKGKNDKGVPVIDVVNNIPCAHLIGNYPLRNGQYHPKVMEWIKKGGGVYEDEVPWARAFVQANRGCGKIVVLNNPPRPNSRHYGFYIGSARDRIFMLCATTPTSVGIAGYDSNRLIGILDK